MTNCPVAFVVAVVAIAFELVALAWIRWRFLGPGFLRSFTSVTVGGAMIVANSARLGAVS